MHGWMDGWMHGWMDALLQAICITVNIEYNPIVCTNILVLKEFFDSEASFTDNAVNTVKMYWMALR